MRKFVINDVKLFLPGQVILLEKYMKIFKIWTVNNSNPLSLFTTQKKKKWKKSLVFEFVSNILYISIYDEIARAQGRAILFFFFDFH